jgi:hypothetical protein
LAAPRSQTSPGSTCPSPQKATAPDDEELVEDDEEPVEDDEEPVEDDEELVEDDEEPVEDDEEPLEDDEEPLEDDEELVPPAPPPAVLPPAPPSPASPGRRVERPQPATLQATRLLSAAVRKKAGSPAKRGDMATSYTRDAATPFRHAQKADADGRRRKARRRERPWERPAVCWVFARW